MHMVMLRPLLLLAAASLSCVEAFSNAPAAMRFSAGNSMHAVRHARRRSSRFSLMAMALPQGWEQVKDPSSGDFYYFNENTGVTQWDAPAAAASSMDAPAAAASSMAKSTKGNIVTGFDVKEFERTGKIVQVEINGNQEEPRNANPVLKIASAGMGLIKPLFVAEASLQAAALGAIAKVSKEDVIAEINENKEQNACVIYTYKLSPFSSEALALLEGSGYQYTNIELGLEWFTLGGRGSQTRAALAGMCENGASSLPKIFIGSKSIGGASGFSALADLVEADELVPLLKAAGCRSALTA